MRPREIDTTQMEKYWERTLCTGSELVKVFGITKALAYDVTERAMDKIKNRRRMELMIEAGAEFNPESVIADYKL